MVKRICVWAFVILGSVFYFSSNVSAQEKIKIGVVRWSGQASYAVSEKGAIDTLKKEGYDESKVIFDMRNAEGKKEKVTEIAKEFKEKKMDLIMAFGTNAMVGVYDVIKDIPIIVGQAFDPIGSGVAKSWEHSGTNVTGASNFVNISSIIDILRVVSAGKRIGVLYSKNEKNTMLQLEKFKELQEKMDFTVIEGNLDKPEQATEVTQYLVDNKVDSIFVTGGAIVEESTNDILKVAIKAKVPTATHTETRVPMGILLGVAPDLYKIGELAGAKAIQVLRGAKPSDIPIETLKVYGVHINLKTANAMGLTIPATLLKLAVKVIKE